MTISTGEGDTGNEGVATEGGESAAGGTTASGTRLAPPRLLSRPAAPSPAPAPLAASGPVTQLHRRWAQLHGAPASAGPEAPAPAVADTGQGAAPAAHRIPGVRAKVRARVATAAAGVQQADRAMTGDLVRAVDALAQRIDEITTRVTDLEALVQDVVDTVSEDLVRLQAALGTGVDDAERAGPTPHAPG